MLVCNVSQRPPRRAIAVEVTEAVVAADATATGNVVFAALVDDPASVGETVDAYLGEIMLEAASAGDIADASIPAVLSADVAEAAAADSAQDGALAAVGPPVTGLIGHWDASVTASLSLTGSSINSVADQSGGGNTMNWVNAKPTYNATGFNSSTKPAIVFVGGGNAALAASSFPMGGGNTLTAWYVGTLWNSAGGGIDCRALNYTAPGQVDYASGSFTIYNAGTATTSASFYSKTTGLTTPATITAYPAPHRFIYTINSSNLVTIYVDGVSMATTTIPGGGYTTGGVARIGTQDGTVAFWTGPIAECGIATGYSDATAVAALDTYLKNKWGL